MSGFKPPHKGIWHNALSTHRSDTPEAFHIIERSDVGQKRLENQDAVGHMLLPDGFLSIVCDGMGGYKGGEVASQLALSSILDYFEKHPILPRRRPFGYLQEALELANEAIWQRSQEDPKLRKMGTTVVALLCVRSKAYIAHVGDSRAYLLRDGALLRITKDHSMIQRLVDEGRLSEEDAESHPQSNVISRVLGQFAQVEVECQPHPIPLKPADRFLLCSDGLPRMLPEAEILDILAHYSDPAYASEKLIQASNQAGGKDNITVQLVDHRPLPNPIPRLISAALALSFVMLALWGWLGPSSTPKTHPKARRPSSTPSLSNAPAPTGSPRERQPTTPRTPLRLPPQQVPLSQPRIPKQRSKARRTRRRRRRTRRRRRRTRRRRRHIRRRRRRIRRRRRRTRRRRRRTRRRRRRTRRRKKRRRNKRRKR